MTKPAKKRPLFDRKTKILKEIEELVWAHSSGRELDPPTRGTCRVVVAPAEIARIVVDHLAKGEESDKAKYVDEIISRWENMWDQADEPKPGNVAKTGLNEPGRKRPGRGPNVGKTTGVPQPGKT